MLLVILLPQVGLYFCPLMPACILTVQVSAWHISINKRLLNDWNKVCKNQHICFIYLLQLWGLTLGLWTC